MRLALYQPDIPQNTGTILRMAACLAVAVDIIAPCGFDMSDRALRRAGLDYLDDVDLCQHRSWEEFYQAFSTPDVPNPDDPTGHETLADHARGRLVLLTTKAPQSYTDFQFRENDTLLLGRESAGVPEDVHGCADERVTIPLARDQRSLNIAVAAAMVLGEALRQTASFPENSGE